MGRIPDYMTQGSRRHRHSPKSRRATQIRHPTRPSRARTTSPGSRRRSGRQNTRRVIPGWIFTHKLEVA
jgi:hypothetical protein